MKIELHSKHLNVSEELQQYIHRRLEFALGDRFDIIKRINVNLSDINGPKGGEDKRCLLVIKLKRQTDLVIETIHTHLHAAIDESAERANRGVVKRIKRLKIRKSLIRKITSGFTKSKRDRYLEEDFLQNRMHLEG
jgi:ribosome-associated translation inhibitor RaiA